MKKISNKDRNWVELKLGSINPLFQAMWRSFEPMVFDEDAESMELEIHNNNFRLVTNPNFWKTCTQNKKLFVICHEMCHVMFGHWLINPNLNREWANIAQDIVVNEYLSTIFCYDPSNDFATIKTVFKHKSDVVERKMDYMYYYNLLMQCLKPSSVKKNLVA